MFMYNIKFSRNVFFLTQWENGCEVKNTIDELIEFLIEIPEK